MCSICHHEERSRYLIDKHIAKHSDKPEESFRCDKCSFVGLNKRSLQYHQKKHEEKYYFCGKCNNLSQTKAQLQSHMNSKHGELKLKCEFCYHKFPCNWWLKQHTERRHSSFKPARSKYGRGKKASIDIFQSPSFSVWTWKIELEMMQSQPLGLESVKSFLFLRLCTDTKWIQCRYSWVVSMSSVAHPQAGLNKIIYWLWPFTPKWTFLCVKQGGI